MIAWLALIIWSFFGWWWKKTQIIESDIPQSSDTWFVENLTNTWSVDDSTNTWNMEESAWIIDTTPEQNTTLQKNYTEIRLMMPRYFYTPSWKDFAKDLYSWEKVHINFIFIDGLNQYRDDLSDENFSDADIILFPYDWNEFVKIQTFSFQKSLKPAFDDFVTDIIQDWDTEFLPFSADPMMMYMLSGYSLNNFHEISKFAENREPTKPMSFPIFYWITDEDYYDKWFEREYKDIMRYALLHYFTTYRNADNEDMLSNWIDSNNLIWNNHDGLENYNVSNLKTILSKIDIPECKYFPSVCFQLYGMVWLRFGFLSDADIVQTYFQAKQNKFTEIQKQNFPFSQTETPVRVWWRAIPNSLTDIDTTNAVYRFLVKYMNSGKEYNLRNSTLPVFKNESNPIFDNPIIWFRWYILTTWWNFIEKLKSTRTFRQLLDYEITAKDYLKRA